MSEELAKRVEALTGPCRGTDKAILLALGYSWRGMNYWHHSERRIWRTPTHFTASLDAAMTLVPEGWGSMEIYAPDADQDGYTVHISDEMRGSTQGFAKTLAAALTAAALRARATGAA